MLARVVSGLVMAAGIVLVLIYAPTWVFGLIVLAAAVLSGDEYLKIVHKEDGFSRGGWFAFALSVLGVAAWPELHKLWSGYTHGVSLTLAFAVLAVQRLGNPLPIEESIQKLALRMLGVVYIGVTFPYVYLLRDQPDGGWVVILVMAIAFGADTGAYFAGRFLGRHKLYPTISPKKTIEGVIGGMATAVGFAFIAKTWLPGLGHLDVVDCILLGSGGALLGVTGDLVESMLKRAYGVKDSGTFIPGHGGALDRIDGLIFTAPFAWIYLQAVG